MGSLENEEPCGSTHEIDPVDIKGGWPIETIREVEGFTLVCSRPLNHKPVNHHSDGVTHWIGDQDGVIVMDYRGVCCRDCAGGLAPGTRAISPSSSEEEGMTRVIMTVVGALVFVALVVIIGNSVEAPVR